MMLEQSINNSVRNQQPNSQCNDAIAGNVIGFPDCISDHEPRQKENEYFHPFSLA